MTQKTEEERLICEIAEKKQKLTDLQLEKASEVQKLYLTDAYGASELRWFLAIVSLVIALCAILGTNKWSTGFPHYFREGTAWFFGLVYFFCGALPLSLSLFWGFEALAKSTNKLKDLPLLIQYQLPAYIGWGSCIAYFFFFYL